MEKKLVFYSDEDVAKIEVYRDEDGRLIMFLDGGFQFLEGEYAEKRYHEVLFGVPTFLKMTESMGSHRDNEVMKIYVFGGGDGLGVREIFRLLPEEGKADVSLVDISRTVIFLGKTLFSPLNERSLEKTSVFIEDAFAFVKKAKAKGDVVVLDYPDPYPFSSQIDRLFSFEHFSDIKMILNDGGVVSIQSGSLLRFPRFGLYVLALSERVFGEAVGMRFFAEGFGENFVVLAGENIKERIDGLKTPFFFGDISTILLKFFPFEEEIYKEFKNSDDSTLKTVVPSRLIFQDIEDHIRNTKRR